MAVSKIPVLVWVALAVVAVMILVAPRIGWALVLVLAVLLLFDANRRGYLSGVGGSP